jgi:hypothetical protein
MEGADENHQFHLDAGSEVDHGNLDNLLAEVVAEDVRRSLLGGGGAP